MPIYLIEVWYRHRDFEKDFAQVEIATDTEKEAHRIAKSIFPTYYKIITIKPKQNEQ